MDVGGEQCNVVVMHDKAIYGTFHNWEDMGGKDGQVGFREVCSD